MEIDFEKEPLEEMPTEKELFKKKDLFEKLPTAEELFRKKELLKEKPLGSKKTDNEDYSYKVGYDTINSGKRD